MKITQCTTTAFLSWTVTGSNDAFQCSILYKVFVQQIYANVIKKIDYQNQMINEVSLPIYR